MAKRYFLPLLATLLLLLPLSQAEAQNFYGASGVLEQSASTNKEMIDEALVYATQTDLVIELKREAEHISIYDITGREVYKTCTQGVGRLHISRDRLPATPALLLVQIVDKEGNIKTFKVKL